MSDDPGWSDAATVEILVLKGPNNTEILKLRFRDLEATATKRGFWRTGYLEQPEDPMRGAPTFDGLVGPSLTSDGTLHYWDPRAEAILTAALR
jgi:hypothetical protein